MESNRNYNFLLKYIIVGNAAVGKSNLLMKFTQNKFTEDYQATIGLEFGSKNIEIKKKIYRIQIWDTAGQETFRSITISYFKNSTCAMVIYDITNRKSFEDVNIWIEEVQNQSPKTVLIILVGNKVDLKDKREVTYDEGKALALKNGIFFMETSAKTGENVYEVFKHSAQEVGKNIEKPNYYNLESSNCGILRGDYETENMAPSKLNQNKNEVALKKGNDKKKEKKGCC